VLLALDAVAALVWLMAPRVIAALGQSIFAARNRPIMAFVAFLIFSIAIYLPMRLVFGDASWLEPDGFPLPIQTSRILLYAGYFFAGVGVGAFSLMAGLFAEDGAFAKRWLVWLGFALVFYAAILGLVYVHHNWVADFNAPPLWWRAGYGLAFAVFSAAMTFTVPAIFLRFAQSSWRLLDALQPSAYGVYLLHYIFIVWLQYAVYDASFHAGVKFAIVFTGTLAMSWGLTLMLRKIPLVARMI
jgi:surface polysaccharide O-acyltransferase-like enzyme